jgi:dolichyl-phosphate beta-glucosyltransferase
VSLLFNVISRKPTPHLSVIIPAHNESARLENTLKEVRDFLGKQIYTSEIIVVDNASTDDTYLIAKKTSGDTKYLRVLQEPIKGKGQAVKTGMLAARGTYRFICDADLSMPITEVTKFIPPAIGNADIIIGSREVKGARRFNEPFYRHFIGRVFNLLVRIMAVPGLQDTQCGFKCFKGEVVDSLFNRQTMTGWAFDVELLVIARKLGLSIIEVPIMWYYGKHSRLNVLVDSFRMFNDLVKIRSNIRNHQYNGGK